MKLHFLSWTVFTVAFVCLNVALGQQYRYPFQNPNLPIEARVNNILSLMTVEEKLTALNTDPSVPRLGIVGYSHIEGLHGVALGGPGGWGGRGLQPLPTTQFPQSVGLGETWDPALIRQAAAVEDYEARYTFNTDTQTSTNWRGEKHRRVGIVVRAPNADLARDPRWGRSEESFGEDPFLTGAMAAAFARGLQGDNPKYWMAASLMKHFLANSNENGRDGSSSDFDERLLREYYSVPFRMGVMQGGSRAYMASITPGTAFPFGDYNPGGRLVTTWPGSLDQLPPMMDYNIRDGRTYMYFKGKPLYPFGYGLSYTPFEYSNLRTSGAQLDAHGEVTISMDLRNTGSRPGDEVVQLYVSHQGSKVERAREELKWFQRVSLQPQKKTTVKFTLKALDLAHWNPDKAAWEVEPDQVEVRIGSSSEDIRLRTSLRVNSLGQ